MAGLFHNRPSGPGDGLLVPLVLHQRSRTQLVKTRAGKVGKGTCYLL